MTKTKMREEGDLLEAIAPAPPEKPPAKRKEKPKAETPPVTTLPAVPRQEPVNLLGAIINAAADPACLPDKMHLLLDVRARLMKEQAHVEFVRAYIGLQAELPVIRKDGKIEIPPKPGARSQRTQITPYATFENINDCTKPILTKHKFALIMLPDVGENNQGILVRGQLAFVCDTQYGAIVHAEHCVVRIPLENSGSKNDAQGVRSSLSYGKRICAVDLLNLISRAPEDRDDDGAATRKKGEPAPVSEETVVPRISAEQLATLREKIKAAGVTDAAFCKHWGIEALEEVPAHQFDDAVKACEERAKRGLRG